jgi:hypothetical protein
MATVVYACRPAHSFGKVIALVRRQQVLTAESSWWCLVISKSLRPPADVTDCPVQVHNVRLGHATKVYKVFPCTRCNNALMHAWGEGPVVKELLHHIRCICSVIIPPCNRFRTEASEHVLQIASLTQGCLQSMYIILCNQYARWHQRILQWGVSIEASELHDLEERSVRLASRTLQSV